MSIRLQHTIIRASAGTGKTYQLANRYIALLLLQAVAGKMAPERLVAVTFTRKGAGEFADRILGLLAAAAGNSKERQKIQQELNLLVNGDPCRNIPGLAPGIRLSPDAETLQRALAVLVDEFDRLVLGTIDGFMARSIQTLAFELGMGGFEILEETTAERLRLELLGEVFREASRTNLEDFYQTLKLATLRSSSSLRQQVKSFVESHHALLHALPLAEAWGGTAFWNVRPPTKPNINWKQQALALYEAVADQDFGHKQIAASLSKALAWLSSRNPGISTGALPAWLDDGGPLQALWLNWPAGDWQFEYSRKTRSIPASLVARLKPVLEGWLAEECLAISDKTGAIHKILAAYENHYDQQARRKGQLVFDDLPILLNAMEEAKTEVISLLAYRWFLQFDHWLLDEFQDTSRVQWGVLKPWLDEAIQDASGCKSVFVVGDAKQSIYGWRGGEPRLFDELKDGYPGVFSERIMVQSWRSRPAVLDLVNCVCDPASNKVLLEPDKLHPSALQRWRYDRHVSEPSRADQRGYAAILQTAAQQAENNHSDSPPGATAEEEADPLSAQARIIKSVLTQTDPLKQGMSCAILVRKNDNAHAIAQWLRANDFPHVLVEGDATLANQSPVVAAIVDALRWLDSPAHTLAGGHLQLTPLGELLQKPLLTRSSSPVPAGRVWSHWRHRAANLGATGITCEWCLDLMRANPDAYAQYCLRQVHDLAHRFGTAITLTEWRSTLEKSVVRETADPGSVHILTIHKAKGLGFDMVFLPDLDLSGGGADEILVRRDDQGQAAGCLVCPPKWLRGWVPELKQLKDNQEADQDLEALCVLYVALTRAKEATFVVMQKEKPRRRSQTREWLRGAFMNNPDSSPIPSPWGEGELMCEFGSRIITGKPDGLEMLPAFARAPVLLAAPTPRRERRKPSETGLRPQQTTPPAMNAEGRKFGAAVHQVFEQIQWWTPGQALRGPVEAVIEVEKCLASSEIRALFTPETPMDEAYCELPVELLENNTWWTGVIDRLVLRRDTHGRLLKAILIDFKTDSAETTETLRDRYSKQLQIYQRAVGLALKIEDCQMEIVIVGTADRILL